MSSQPPPTSVVAAAGEEGGSSSPCVQRPAAEAQEADVEDSAAAEGEKDAKRAKTDSAPATPTAAATKVPGHVVARGPDPEPPKPLATTLASAAARPSPASGGAGTKRARSPVAAPMYQQAMYPHMGYPPGGYGYPPGGYAPPPGYAPQPGYAHPGYAPPPSYAPQPGYAPQHSYPPGYTYPPGAYTYPPGAYAYPPGAYPPHHGGGRPETQAQHQDQPVDPHAAWQQQQKDYLSKLNLWGHHEHPHPLAPVLKGPSPALQLKMNKAKLLYNKNLSKEEAAQPGMPISAGHTDASYVYPNGKMGKDMTDEERAAWRRQQPPPPPMPAVLVGESSTHSAPGLSSVISVP